MPSVTAQILNLTGSDCPNMWDFSLKSHLPKPNILMPLYPTENSRRQEVVSVDGTQVCVFSVRKEVLLRPFTREDYVPARALLRELPALYPGGDAWLKRRLCEALSGMARCTVAASPYGLAGITIETPKKYSRLKLSTLYIHPNFRRSGLGTRMLEACRQTWIFEGIQQVHVTVDARRSSSLTPLLFRAGFRYTDIEHHRYGPGRHEIVFHWHPSFYADTNGSYVNPLTIQ